MKKILITSIVAIAGVMFFAPHVFASDLILTDHSTYVAPATVLFTSANPGIGGHLYFNATGTPVCTAPGGIGSSGNLWTVFCGGYTASSTIGNYEVLTPDIAGCAALTYAACVAANTGMPGNHEADFSITSGGGGGASIDNINDPPTIFNFLLYDVVYTSIAVVIAGIFILMFRLT